MTKEKKYAYLVMVTSEANHNKIYKMTSNGNGTWTAEYGRVGSSMQKRIYSLNLWDSKYREKIRKGYIDQTEIMEDLVISEKSSRGSEYKKIKNPSVAELVNRLMEMANQAIESNYNISANKVTQAMVTEAQNLITELIKVDRVKDFNDILLRIFTAIPRKMSNVNSFLANSSKDFPQIIQNEQDLLDVMKSKVISIEKEDNLTGNEEQNKKSETILQAMGLEIEECDESDISTIKHLLGGCSSLFYRAWKVKNLGTQKRFDEFCKNENVKDKKLLWHGSRNENWWSIINTGLVLRPTNAVITGKMFGMGCYFAPKARKSLGYTSLSGSYWARGSSSFGFMALMDVAYGKPYDVYSFEREYHSFDYERLQKKCSGANCLHAHAGTMLKNDEIVVYREEQITIKYLVELK